MARALTPYQRIVRAANRQSGVRLSAEDVQAMAMDSAILMLAENDDEDSAGVRRYGSFPQRDCALLSGRGEGEGNG